jgi:phosphomannomutase
LSIPFGTDGWRGVIAEDCTFDTIRRIAAAAARAYGAQYGPGDASRIVIGHDTRFYSPEFAAAVAETFARAGIGVLLTDRPIPTPAVSYHVHRMGLAGGVAITASHNPGAYNGFKLKAHFGGSATPQMYDAVSREDGRPARKSARAAPVEKTDLLGPYRAHLASLVDLPAMREAGLAILADSMHGAAGTLLADILDGGRTRVVRFRERRDPNFGGVHPEPIAANLAAAAERVVSDRLDLAVAQDGDADRLGVLDRRGQFVSPHRVLALLLLHAFRRRGLSGGIAKTFSTSLLIDRVAARLGMPLEETPIGFKYIAELMNARRITAGGEESGGYAFSFHLPERDGVLCALLLIESLALERRDLDGALAALAGEFGELAYGRRDVYLPVEVIRRFLREVQDSPPRLLAGEEITSVRGMDGVKYLFGDRGWLLHRLSGTEPMIRLYCEHASEEAVGKILDAGEDRLAAFARSEGETPRAHL